MKYLILVVFFGGFLLGTNEKKEKTTESVKEENKNCKDFETLEGNEIRGGYSFDYSSKKCKYQDSSFERSYTIINHKIVSLPVIWENKHEVYFECNIPGQTTLTVTKNNFPPIEGITSIGYGLNRDEYKTKPKTFIANPELGVLKKIDDKPLIFQALIKGTFLIKEKDKTEIDLKIESSVLYINEIEKYSISFSIETFDEGRYIFLPLTSKEWEEVFEEFEEFEGLLSIRMTIFDNYQVEENDGLISKEIRSPELVGFFEFENAPSYEIYSNNNLEIYYENNLAFRTTVPLYIPADN